MSLSPSSSEMEAVCYLFGHPIAHSLSPLLHKTVYEALGISRAQIPFPSTDIEEFLNLTKDPKFYGASVTMPHKLTIMRHLDKLADEAVKVGACNTIFVREVDGKRLLCGTNTDIVGIREAFFQNVPDPSVFQKRPGMIIGGGGAARSAVYAMKQWMHCDPIYLVNRDALEVRALMTQYEQQKMDGRLIPIETYEQAEQLESPGAIVACVPNLPPKCEPEFRTRDIINVMLAKARKGAVLEMCYHPSPWTEIATLARDADWQVILGTEAMIWQGLEQDRYWTGVPIERLPIQEVKAAIHLALAQSEI
ncbi:MAG: hypothetical protein Q9160_007805 [Pyrenula sp. 1 TL-2023]